MSLDGDLASLAAKQHGVFTRPQARHLGFTDDAAEWKLARRCWLTIHRGVYRLPGTPVTWEQSVKAACLFTGGVASHHCAGSLLGLPGLERRVEVTVSRSHSFRLEGVAVYRSSCLEWCDRERLGCIPLTSVARTIIDLAGVLDSRALEAVLDHALATRKVPYDYLAQRLNALGGRGRAGTKQLKELVRARRGAARFADSEPQRELLRAIRSAGMPEPVLEFPLRLEDGAMAFADAAYPEVGLIIEVDSYRHHSSLSDWARDHARSGDLVAMGWSVLPVTTVQLRKNPSAVAQKISRALSRRRAGSRATSPGPSPGK